jgi:hypothetical protein
LLRDELFLELREPLLLDLLDLLDQARLLELGPQLLGRGKPRPELLRARGLMLRLVLRARGGMPRLVLRARGLMPRLVLRARGLMPQLLPVLRTRGVVPQLLELRPQLLVVLRARGLMPRLLFAVLRAREVRPLLLVVFRARGVMVLRVGDARLLLVREGYLQFMLLPLLLLLLRVRAFMPELFVRTREPRPEFQAVPKGDCG